MKNTENNVSKIQLNESGNTKDIDIWIFIWFFFKKQVLNFLDKYLKYIYLVLKPFEVISENKTEFFIWSLFTLFAGQLGIITNLIIRVFGTQVGFKESLYLDALAGNFYLYSIAIIASMLGSVFTTFLNAKETSFRHIRIIASSVLVLFLVFNAIVYSATQLRNSVKIETNFYYTFDWLQLGFYVISMMFSVYCFCLIKLYLPKYLVLSDDYGTKETKEVDELSRNAIEKTSDGELQI